MQTHRQCILTVSSRHYSKLTPAPVAYCYSSADLQCFSRRVFVSTSNMFYDGDYLLKRKSCVSCMHK